MTDINDSKARPDWVSSKLYPFVSRYFETSRGRIHYVDEGVGTPIVFVHGNPSWSFEYRHLIAALRNDYRCIAPDHLGFGLSDRSRDKADYHPEAHADNFAALMEHLNLNHVTLVFSDWGGPIALDFARKHPERVEGLVILNSWCWPVDTDRHFVRFSAMMSSWPMQFLIRRFNFFVTQVTPKAVGNPAILTKEVMAHYINAQPDPESRAASAALPGYIIGATDWLRKIWNGRAAFTDKPALVIWGHKDIAFRRKELETWQAELKNCTVHELPECGHFLAEEAPEVVTAHIRAFVGKQEAAAL
jgi:haloalkane dehalogenase